VVSGNFGGICKFLFLLFLFKDKDNSIIGIYRSLDVSRILLS